MHVLRKVLYNWSWIRIGTYDNELQASTAVKSRFHVGTWSTITAIHLVFFSRSHYEFIIVRATRVSFRRIRKEEREVPRGKICGQNGREAKEGARWERQRWRRRRWRRRRGTVVVTVGFFARETGRTDPVNPEGQNGTRCPPPPPTLTAATWIWGTPGSRFPDSYALLPIDLNPCTVHRRVRRYCKRQMRAHSFTRLSEMPRNGIIASRSLM